MLVIELINLLSKLEQNAVIDMASDEEGNSFGDVSTIIGKGRLKKNKVRVYSLYPENSELPEERYHKY